MTAPAMITGITIFALMVTIGSQPSYKRDEFDSLHLVVVEARTIDCASIILPMTARALWTRWADQA